MTPSWHLHMSSAPGIMTSVTPGNIRPFTVNIIIIINYLHQHNNCSATTNYVICSKLRVSHTRSCISNTSSAQFSYKYLFSILICQSMTVFMIHSSFRTMTHSYCWGFCFLINQILKLNWKQDRRGGHRFYYNLRDHRLIYSNLLVYLRPWLA